MNFKPLLCVFYPTDKLERLMKVVSKLYSRPEQAWVIAENNFPTAAFGMARQSGHDRLFSTVSTELGNGVPDMCIRRACFDLELASFYVINPVKFFTGFRLTPKFAEKFGPAFASSYHVTAKLPRLIRYLIPAI
jgi:hypothetical protein